MAITTCKKFTYAKVSGGGNGSAVTYTGGTMLDDYLAKVDINEERTDEKEYADGHLIDSEKIPTGVSMANRFKGAITWEGYWIYKIQFAMQGKSAETRRERTSFQHESINGDGVGVKLASDGAIVYYAYKSGMTEAAAEAWLKGHAGISG